MSYLIPIFLILAVLFGTGAGNHLPGIKQVQGSILDSLFPKNEKEILIDNVNKQYETISRFFSAPTMATLLTSKTLTDQQKADLKTAIDTIAATKQDLQSLTVKEKTDQNLVK